VIFNRQVWGAATVLGRHAEIKRRLENGGSLEQGRREGD